MKPARGVTLMELLAAVAILSVAVTVAGRLVMEAVRLARAAEETAGSNDAARLALEAIARDARLAGMGAGGGLWVNRGGVPGRGNALHGGTGAGGGPDGLWLVVPHVNALKQSCASAEPPPRWWPGAPARCASPAPPASTPEICCW